MIKFLISLLILISTIHSESSEGKYVFVPSNTEYYELELDKESFILKNRIQDSKKESLTTILGNYKYENKKIILTGTQEINQTILPTGEQETKEKVYKGSPIRVHIQNKDEKTILVLSAFGKILKLNKSE
jgi:hypothetical protein